QMSLGEQAEDAELEGRARRADCSFEVLNDAFDHVRGRSRSDWPLGAYRVGHLVDESSRSTSSRTAAATTDFGAFGTARSRCSESPPTCLAGPSKPMPSPPTSLNTNGLAFFARRFSRARSRP